MRSQDNPPFNPRHMAQAEVWWIDEEWLVPDADRQGFPDIRALAQQQWEESQTAELASSQQ